MVSATGLNNESLHPSCPLTKIRALLPKLFHRTSSRGHVFGDRLTSGQGQNQTNNPNMTGGVEVKCRDDLTQRERGVQ